MFGWFAAHSTPAGTLSGRVVSSCTIIALCRYARTQGHVARTHPRSHAHTVTHTGTGRPSCAAQTAFTSAEPAALAYGIHWTCSAAHSVWLQCEEENSRRATDSHRSCSCTPVDRPRRDGSSRGVLAALAIPSPPPSLPAAVRAWGGQEGAGKCLHNSDRHCSQSAGSNPQRPFFALAFDDLASKPHPTPPTPKMRLMPSQPRGSRQSPRSRA